MHNNFSYYIMFAYIFFLQMSHEKQEKKLCYDSTT